MVSGEMDTTRENSENVGNKTKRFDFGFEFTYGSVSKYCILLLCSLVDCICNMNKISDATKILYNVNYTNGINSSFENY